MQPIEPRAMKLIDKKEVATIFKLSVRTIDRMRATGELRAVKVRGRVRFEETEVEKVVRENREPSVN